MNKHINTAREAVYNLSPVDPLVLDLQPRQDLGPVLTATRAFRVADTSYCAGVAHRVRPQWRGLTVVEGLGLKKGTLTVRWR